MVITAPEKTLIDQIAADGAAANVTPGIQSDTDHDGVGDQPYAETILPIEGYEKVVYTPERQAQVLDGIRAAQAPAIRRVMPFGFDLKRSTISPSLTNSGAVASILNVPFGNANRMSVARIAMANLSFTAYSTVGGTSVVFSPRVNTLNAAGAVTSYSDYQGLKFYFNDANKHQQISGSWLITLPAEILSIDIIIYRDVGTGVITLNADDCVSLAVLG